MYSTDYLRWIRSFSVEPEGLAVMALYCPVSRHPLVRFLSRNVEPYLIRYSKSALKTGVSCRVGGLNSSVVGCSSSVGNLETKGK
jgi:hypothetical protein